MKKYLTIIAFSVMAILCQAQNFSKNYVLYDDIDQGWKVLPYENGYLIQVFGKYGIPIKNDFLAIFQTNNQGELQKKMLIDTLIADEVLNYKNGKLIFGASFNQGDDFYKKLYLQQIDLNGNKIKEGKYKFSQGFHFISSLDLVNNNYYLVDQAIYSGDNYNDKIYKIDSINILKFDSSFIYKKTITCPYKAPIIFTFSTTFHSDNYIVCALSEQDTNNYDMKHVVIAFDSMGIQKWLYIAPNNIIPFQKTDIKTIGFSNNSTAILFPYITDSFYIPQQRVLKFDSVGNIVWKYDDMSVQKEGTQEFISMFKTQNDDLVVVGHQYFVQKNEDRRTGVIMRVSKDGKLKWKRRVWDLNTPFGHSGFHNGVELEGGSLLITGWWRDTASAPNYDTNVWLIKLDSNGCYNPGCSGDDIVASQHNIIVLSKDLLKISPNPAPNQILCSWSNTPSEAKYISVFDLNGVEIMKQDVTAKAGNISIDISRVPSGVYFVKLFGDRWESSPEKIVKE